MGRTALTPKEISRIQSVSVTAGAADLTMAASDIVDGNSIAWTGKEMLIVHNTNIGVQTVTIDAAPDEYGRDGTITTYSLAADDYAIFGPFDGAWKQTDGTIHVDGTAVDVLLGVLRIKSLA